jgi:hypothetical protein
MTGMSVPDMREGWRNAGEWVPPLQLQNHQIFWHAKNLTSIFAVIELIGVAACFVNKQQILSQFCIMIVAQLPVLFQYHLSLLHLIQPFAHRCSHR